MHVERARQAIAIPSGKHAAEEIHARDRLGVERAEQTLDVLVVVRLEQRDAIEIGRHFVFATATDVRPHRDRVGSHAWQIADGSHRVLKQSGQRLQILT